MGMEHGTGLYICTEGTVMFFWVAMCYNLYKSMFVREVKKCLAQKLTKFLIIFS